MIAARHLTFVLVVCLTLSALAATSAAAAEVRIKNARSGELKTVQFDIANADVEADYLIRGAAGEQSQRIKGISLARLIELANADPVYSAIDVDRIGGGAVRVSKYSILGQGLVPVVYQDGPNLVFVRPSSSSTDLNAADVISSGSGLDLTQQDLGALDVNAKVSKKKVKAGALVKFTASASGGGAGDQFEFKWNFNDGKTADGDSVSHRFKERGTYKVVVNARIVGSDRSDPAVVVVQVGEPTKSDKKRSGGGTNDSAGAPASGVADGDSGDGDTASSGQSKKKRSRQQPEQQRVTETALPVVEGELLAATAAAQPVDQSSLAARSGQQTAESASSGFGLPREAWAVLGTVALIGAGMLFEFGVPSAARRRLRGIS